MMKVILNNSTAEIVEKKSKFIANISYADDENSALDILNATKKKYYDAKHNCFAYILGKNGDLLKSSDDGEPQGTAGHPMIDILRGNELTNCIAIVTRYFGGILLGTGGLVRAYSDSLKQAIANAKTSELKNAYKVSFDINYDDYGKIENLVQNINLYSNQIITLDKTFEDVVKLKYLVNENSFDKFKSDISNITKGKIILENNDIKVYYIDDKEVRYLR